LPFVTARANRRVSRVLCGRRGAAFWTSVAAASSRYDYRKSPQLPNAPQTKQFLHLTTRRPARSKATERFLEPACGSFALRVLTDMPRRYRVSNAGLLLLRPPWSLTVYPNISITIQGKIGGSYSADSHNGGYRNRRSGYHGCRACLISAHRGESGRARATKPDGCKMC
jgi:hypothetical protein